MITYYAAQLGVSLSVVDCKASFLDSLDCTVERSNLKLSLRPMTNWRHDKWANHGYLLENRGKVAISNSSDTTFVSSCTSEVAFVTSASSTDEDVFREHRQRLSDSFRSFGRECSGS